MKKIILAILSLALLLAILLSTEEKQDFLSEEIYWKKSINTIRYYPPKPEWKGSSKSEFIQEEWELSMADRGSLTNPPIFTIQSIQGNILYEGGFHVKNLFSELSAFKIKSVTSAQKDYLDEYKIDKDLSPRLEIIENNNPVSLYLGEEIKDKSVYSLSEGDFLLSASAHTFRRFQSKPESFRERNLVTVGNGFIKKIHWKSGNQYLEIENSPTENSSGGNQNIWRRNSGNRLVFEPRLGDDLDSSLKSLRYEKYPDEDSDGLSVVQELVKLSPEDEWTILTSEGRKLKIILFPKTLIGDKEYRPVIRSINDSIIETPAYVNNATVERMKQSGEKIRNAIQWQRPEKKIQ